MKVKLISESAKYNHGKIFINELHPDNVNTFMHVVTNPQLDTILGGFGYPNIFIKNNTDQEKINSFGDNTIEGAGSYNYRDNKINTLDNARSNFVNVFS